MNETKEDASYTVPIHVTYLSSTNTTIHILGSNLDWKILLHDIKCNKALLQWHLYGKKRLERPASRLEDDDKAYKAPFKGYMVSNSKREISETGFSKKLKCIQGMKEEMCCICFDEKAEQEYKNNTLSYIPPSMYCYVVGFKEHMSYMQVRNA